VCNDPPYQIQVYQEAVRLRMRGGNWSLLDGATLALSQIGRDFVAYTWRRRNWELIRELVVEASLDL
jgi:16S rRNA G966 N2-methylase RsmD